MMKWCLPVLLFLLGYLGSREVSQRVTGAAGETAHWERSGGIPGGEIRWQVIPAVRGP